MEVSQPKKEEKEVEMIKPVQIPELRREIVATPISQIGLGSIVKKENVVLTESIEMTHRKE